MPILLEVNNVEVIASMNIIYWIVGIFAILLAVIVGMGLWTYRQEKSLFKKLRWKVVFSSDKPKVK